MNRLIAVVAVGLALVSACSSDRADPRPEIEEAEASVAPPPSGERLAYIVGCVNCHHQTPKEMLNAPPLIVVQGYTLPEFKTLLKTGVTRDGRDMYARGSIMGIVAREQLSFLTDQEVGAIHDYLQNGWTSDRAAKEEAKIATFPAPTFLAK